MKIEEKLFLTSFKPDESASHLIVRFQEVCASSCEGRPCTSFCPAHVYEWEGDHISVAYNGCLECGACRIGCPFGNIEWRYPRGGFGVQYRYG
ncbi:MAG: 4Fe-4S dicluster domain-containing protein [Bacteroidetes bacterium]|nr:4Fe-4S dicluster domain-containing protein [Bacteroidota bacterium]